MSEQSLKQYVLSGGLFQRFNHEDYEITYNRVYKTNKDYSNTISTISHFFTQHLIKLSIIDSQELRVYETCFFWKNP